MAGVAGVAVALLAGCGGVAQRGHAGEGEQAGQAGQLPDEPPPHDPFWLDDNFPWFDADGTMIYLPGGEGRILRLPVPASPARGTFSTHNPIDLIAQTSSLRFSARANAPAVIKVAVGHEQLSYNYFAAREAGSQWPVATVMVTPEWQDFTVHYADLVPLEPADASHPGFYVAFVVDQVEPIELFIDRVSAD